MAQSTQLERITNEQLRQTASKNVVTTMEFITIEEGSAAALVLSELFLYDRKDDN
jgi:hypothetical protein